MEIRTAMNLSRGELRSLEDQDRGSLGGAIQGALTIFRNQLRYPEDCGGDPTPELWQEAGDAHVLETRLVALQATRGPKEWWRQFGRRLCKKRGARNNNY